MLSDTEWKSTALSPPHKTQRIKNNNGEKCRREARTGTSLFTYNGEFWVWRSTARGKTVRQEIDISLTIARNPNYIQVIFHPQKGVSRKDCRLFYEESIVLYFRQMSKENRRALACSLSWYNQVRRSVHSTVSGYKAPTLWQTSFLVLVTQF